MFNRKYLFFNPFIFLLLIGFLGSCSKVSDQEDNLPDFNSLEWFEADLAYNKTIKQELTSRDLFNKIVFKTDQETDTSFIGNHETTRVYQDVPYTRYWQMKDTLAYVIHPMALGKHLFLNYKSYYKNPEKLNHIKAIGYQSQDGGLAFYYPEHYTLDRMIGPDISYSAISQSQLVAGFVHADSLKEEVPYYVKETVKSLLYDYYKGGVNLSNKALLEMPLLRSAPEIILNGWLHALVHLNDYARIYKDSATNQILKSNLEFLITHHNNWYDSSKNISLYSDLSPYNGRISFNIGNTVTEQEIMIRYLSKIKGIKNQKVPLNYDDTTTFGIYDNQLKNESFFGNSADIVFNCSNMFATVITANSPFDLTFNLDEYDPLASAPNANGKEITLTSIYSKANKCYYVNLDSCESLTKGYPTNFSKKNKKNYYHVQHIVAMLYLANFCEAIDENQKNKLIAIASKWYKNTLDYPFMEISKFESPQKVLDGLNSGKVITDITSVDSLFKLSKVTKTW